MEPLLALLIATAIYGLIVLTTYLLFVKKSPPEHRKIRTKELAVIAALVATFFLLGLILLTAFGPL